MLGCPPTVIESDPSGRRLSRPDAGHLAGQLRRADIAHCAQHDSRRGPVRGVGPAHRRSSYSRPTARGSRGWTLRAHQARRSPTRKVPSGALIKVRPRGPCSTVVPFHNHVTGEKSRPPPSSVRSAASSVGGLSCGACGAADESGAKTSSGLWQPSSPGHRPRFFRSGGETRVRRSSHPIRATCSRHSRRRVPRTHTHRVHPRLVPPSTLPGGCGRFACRRSKALARNSECPRSVMGRRHRCRPGPVAPAPGSAGFRPAPGLIAQHRVRAPPQKPWRGGGATGAARRRPGPD